MTVQEIGERGMSFVPDTITENGDLKKFFVRWVNILLAETLNNENAYREASGLPRLTAAPVLKNLTDEIPYNEKLVAAAFPYGVARWIFRDEDDGAASQEYYVYYVNALNENTPAVFKEIETFY